MREMRRLTLLKPTRRAAGWFGAQFRPVHEPSPRSGVSAERRWLLFPRIAALCRDAATPGFMVPMRVHNGRCFLSIKRAPSSCPSPPVGEKVPGLSNRSLGEGGRAVEEVRAKRPPLFRSATGPRSQRLRQHECTGTASEPLVAFGYAARRDVARSGARAVPRS